MTKKTKTPEGAEPREQYAELASITEDALPDDVQALRERIADLEAKLAVTREERDDAQKAALAAAEAQGMLMQREIKEVATGKFATVMRAYDEKGRQKVKTVSYKDDGRPILRPVMREVQIPTYFYKIDIPPIGGFNLQINDIALYHGMVYELDIDTLRTVKEMVYRLWKHDADIHGSDENAYRKEKAPTFSMRSGQRGGRMVG